MWPRLPTTFELLLFVRHKARSFHAAAGDAHDILEGLVTLHVGGRESARRKGTLARSYFFCAGNMPGVPVAPVGRLIGLGVLGLPELGPPPG